MRRRRKQRENALTMWQISISVKLVEEVKGLQDSSYARS